MIHVHVLIVEDNEPSRYLLKVLLEGNGYRVTQATNGVEALAAAHLEPPDIIVSDALMPQMDGFDLCRAWMQDEQLKAIPFVFYSATYTSPDDEKLALSLGAVLYLIKPMEPQLFLATLQNVLMALAARPTPGVAEPLAEPDFRALHDMALARKLEHKMAQLSEANLKLSQSERNYRQLFEDNPLPMWVCDLETLSFLAVNDAAVAAYGYSRAEFLAMALTDIRPSTEWPRLRQAMEGVKQGIPLSGVWQHRKKDGTLIQVEVTSHLIEFIGHHANMVLAQDVTERERAWEQVRRYTEQLKSVLMGTVQVTTSLSELRDPYTAGHERRVASIATAIGSELGLPPQRLEGLRVAGLLHDIGKITIPSEILSKPGRLRAPEYQLIQNHPQDGYEVLKEVHFPWPVAEVVRQHHERLDGCGYPQGLKGEAILFEARILAVADVVEAMNSHRPYRPGLGIDKALAEIERGRGTMYDPVVVDACLTLFREKGFLIPE
jgi:PAS domain S-box-containing protein/putative nucleotidyltransferase with HDIG domain